MDISPFQQWLDAYGSAWQTRNPQAAVALYTDEGTYQVTPFLEPLRGSQAILDYWTEITRTVETSLSPTKSLRSPSNSESPTGRLPSCVRLRACPPSSMEFL
jgi:hypothetical protein